MGSEALYIHNWYTGYARAAYYQERSSNTPLALYCVASATAPLLPSLCLSLFPSPSYPQYDRARYPLPAHHRCGGVDRLRTLMVSNLAGLSWLRPYKVQLI